MKLNPHHLAAVPLLMARAAFAGEALPQTVLCKRGALLVNEDFAKPVAGESASFRNVRVWEARPIAP